MTRQAAFETTLPTYVKAVGPGEWKLLVWVQPGAKRSELSGVYQDRLKIRLAAPAVDNKANKALVRFVAGLLDVKKSCVSLASGMTSRGKTLAVNSERKPRWTAVATGQ